MHTNNHASLMWNPFPVCSAVKSSILPCLPLTLTLYFTITAWTVTSISVILVSLNFLGFLYRQHTVGSSHFGVFTILAFSKTLDVIGFMLS